MTDNLPEIPDFLRVLSIRKDVLQDTIEAISKTKNQQLEKKLRDILYPPRSVGSISVPIPVQEGVREGKIRLTKKRKEATAAKIAQLIDDGHNTFARLKKCGIDERLLKSAIRYGLAHDVWGARIIKSSRKIYNVNRRKK
jgi:hypothetical protein